MNWLKQHVGELIVATGVIHTIYSVATQRPVIGDLWRDGLVNSVHDDDPQQIGWLWFTTTGFAWISGGLLARSHIRHTGTLPGSFGASLLAASHFNAALAPKTGTWLVVAEAVIALAVAADGDTACQAGPFDPRAAVPQIVAKV